MDVTDGPEWEERMMEVNETLIYNLARLEETEDRVAELNETLMMWTKEKFATLNKTLHVDLTLMQDSIMQLQEMMMEDVGSGVEVYHNTTLVMAEDNTTLDTNIIMSGNNDEPDNFTQMSAQVGPGNMEGGSKWCDMIEGRVISYITLFMASTGLLVSFVLIYKLKDLP